MTVKNLIKSVTFEEVAAALQRTHFRDVENFIGESAEYKMAYDQLCQISSNGVGGVVTFDMASHDALEIPDIKTITANNVEGECWEDLLCKEIIRPTDNVTDEELTGAILWGATFYGFTPYRPELGINLLPMSGIIAAKHF